MTAFTIAAKIECAPVAQPQLADDATSLLASWSPSVMPLAPGDEDVPLGGIEVTCTIQAAKQILAVDALNEAIWMRLGLVAASFDEVTDDARELVPA